MSSNPAILAHRTVEYPVSLQVIHDPLGNGIPAQPRATGPDRDIGQVRDGDRGGGPDGRDARLGAIDASGAGLKKL